jgi:hypothetical protein
MSDTPTYKEVWETLSPINVNEYVKEIPSNRGPALSYLSWTFAWKTMMENYPSVEVVFHNPVQFNDKSMEVSCTVNIGKDVARFCWLPVMDYKHNAVINPNARQISDARQRCMVKAFGFLGLGHYIYAGEDLPDAAKDEKPVTSGLAIEPPNTGPREGEFTTQTRGEIAMVTFGAFLDGCTDPDEVSKHWTDNAKLILEIKASEPTNYGKLHELFSAAKTRCKEGNK